MVLLEGPRYSLRMPIVDWDGSRVPDELKALPPGRYQLVPLDEAVQLTDAQEKELRAAMRSVADGQAVSHDAVSERIRQLTDP